MNQTVSHYQILEKLGGGGMGVVYRARDLKLEREVALKFLPEEFTPDAAARERFEREARLAAAINHPNICTIYEVGECNGTPFLAMELLDGATLKHHIDSKPVDLNELLDWAVQIATGLDAAHARGILHRDLKPANLFITNTGQAKILDFGLAKLRKQPKPASAGGSENLTTIVHTDPGGSMGTPAYMSPEQAEGEALDARTDLFSFGIVLYEMATGKLPFEGPSAAAIIASVLRDSPVPPCHVNPELPPQLGRIIEKALEKDPDTRYQTAADLRSDLKRVGPEMDSGALTTIAIAGASRSRREPRRRSGFDWLIAGAVGGLMLVVAALFFTRPLPPPRVLSTTQITHDRRAKSAPFLTDGSRLYFNTGDYLTPQPYQVSIKGGESVPLPIALPNALAMDISPDRSELLVGSFGFNPYVFNSATLWIVPVLGGSPTRVGDRVVGSAAWSPDGRELVFTKEREKEIDICRVDGTGTRRLATVPGIPSFPRWSPDGKTIRFTVEPVPSTDWSRFTNQMPASSLWEVRSDGRGLHSLLPNWGKAQCCGNWTPDGRYFVFQAGTASLTTIWATREADSFLHRNTHRPVQLTTGPMSTYGPVPSADGTRIFIGGRQPRIEVVRFDLKANQFVPFLSGISAEGLDFSRDAKWITYSSYPERTLWRSTIDGTQRLQLTSPPLEVSLPRWSPDGKWIAFMGSYPGAAESIFLVSADGGKTQQLTKGQNSSDPTWSADGTSIAFSGYPLDRLEAAHNLAIRIFNLKSLQTTTLPGSEGLWSPRWSPDGRHIAALTTDSQRLMLFDFESRKWAELGRANFGYPSWSRDSEYIYYDTVGVDAALFRVRVHDREVERIARLRDVQRKRGAFGAWSGLTPDGSALLARDASFDEIYALDWQAP